MSSVPSDPATWERLGKIARRRREELELTQAEVAGRAGVATQTVHRLEKGARPSRHTSSWSKLERALGWLPGSVDAILEGGVPAAGSVAYDFERLGAVIAERMEELGLSQVELARRTGLHRVTIGRIVKGQLKSPPSPVTAQALERALGWLPASIEAILEGGVPTEGSYDGKFPRIPISNEVELVRDLVRKIAFEIDPDTPLSRVVAAEAVAEAELRRIGLLPPLNGEATDDGPSNE